MTQRDIALVTGDGAAPEMMAVACEVVEKAASLHGSSYDFHLTPMGWNAFEEHGDTFPESSFEEATELDALFFGGVGDPKLDETLGKKHPEMRPEARCLLNIRAQWGLLLNFRPMVFRKDLADFAKVRPEFIPEAGVEQHWIRFLLEDTYFGTSDLLPQWIEELGADHPVLKHIKLKPDVTGDEEMVVDLAYFKKATIEAYLRYAFQYAREKGLPLISVDKANVMARYKFWRDIATRIGDEEFPDVERCDVLVDAGNAILFEPAKLHGVIACGNEHGDILSDGAAGAVGSLGLMHSSAINPDNGKAMFESGAGTAADIAGKGIANPIGRILTGAMMMRHLGDAEAATAIEQAVKSILDEGWRTGDIKTQSTYSEMVLGTEEIGEKIIDAL
jgi:3-isopropylmalate dehydrogenase